MSAAPASEPLPPPPKQPDPARGRLVRYDYLWAREHSRSQQNGLKPRNCLIWSAKAYEGFFIVDVLPLSTSSSQGVKLTEGECLKLKLDAGVRIVTSEANRFVLLGPDIEIQPDGAYYIGAITHKIAARVAAALSGTKPEIIVPRTGI